MYLYVNKENPLEGRHNLEFDDNGYVVCFKVYDARMEKLTSCYLDRRGEVFPVWIVSDRKSREIGHENGDITYYGMSTSIFVEHGIHVFINKELAKVYFRGRGRWYKVVPVRCHKSQLVAIGRYCSKAVFMKVFLRKADYEKAIKENEDKD